jgi:serine/threonine protein phosphatase 1
MKKKPAEGLAGARAYAIGDVHGCADLLEELLTLIERDNRARPSARTFLVTLGDLVDRGPDSCGVIDRFVNSPPAWAKVIHLRGNHEECFSRVLEGDVALVPNWLTYGGYECAESYGLDRNWMIDADPHDIAARLSSKVPQSHKNFLSDMADTFQFGDYLFVHAGVRPGVPIDEQIARDLRWIRGGFLDDSTDHGVMVVHGHTIVGEPELLPNRIAVDTGAYRSGILTAIGLEGAERWFIDTRARLAESGAGRQSDFQD